MGKCVTVCSREPRLYTKICVQHVNIEYGIFEYSNDMSDDASDNRDDESSEQKNDRNIIEQKMNAAQQIFLCVKAYW